MGPSVTLIDQIHIQALEVSSRYKKAVADLVEILQDVEAHQVYLERGHSSLYAYAVAELGLGENVTYSLITVARKAREVPELKDRLKTGKMTFSNARRVASVLTVENKEEWLQKASELSNRKLQKEIVKVRPKEATPERTSYVTPDRVRVEIGLSEKEMLKLRRVQDLLCQSKRRPVSLEETIEALTQEFLRRHDPLEKAKRHRVRKGSGIQPGSGAQEVEAELVTLQGQQSDPVSGMPGNGDFELVTPRVQGSRDFLETADTKEIELVTPRVLMAEDPHQEADREDVELVTQREYERVPIPAETIHQLNLRDQRRCVFVLSDGSRCNQTRWLDYHHRIPVSQGGTNSLENLVTLCSAHHRFLHLRKGERS